MQAAPYGSWKSPVTTDVVTGQVVKLAEPRYDGADLYWLEYRPSEGGRGVIVCRSDTRTFDVTAPEYNVRSLVHEYGGGSYTVHDGIVYFCNYADQRIYSQRPAEAPVPLTPELPCRFADLIVDAGRQRLICVQEDCTNANEEPEAAIVSIPLAGGPPEVLLFGNPFYAFPRLSLDGSKLAWMSWSHPSMPWDESQIWACDLGRDGCPANIRKVAGGAGISVFQPEWSPDGRLFYVSDQTGWWNLFLHNDYDDPLHLVEMKAEFASPQWVFGLSTYAFVSSGRLICTYTQNGRWHLAEVDVERRSVMALELPYSDFSYVACTAHRLAFIAGAAHRPASLIEMSLADKSCATVKSSISVDIDEGYLSDPEFISYPTTDGDVAFAILYRPKNADYTGERESVPPLLVKCHGGPTGSCSSTLDLGRIQFWTSRGFAVVDVNYRGSTGFGRAFREKIKGRSGVVEIDDCIAAADYVTKNGWADRNKVAISGGSAGGYIVLCAVTFHDFFAAGASYYGISDCEALAADTHKFESRYLEQLIGPYPARKDLYRQRSPVHFVDRVSCPVIFMQGSEDKVVAAEQSFKMVEALRRNGVPVSYIEFAGEQHGFRKAETIKRALSAELCFYSRVLAFPCDEAPVEIYNEANLRAPAQAPA